MRSFLVKLSDIGISSDFPYEVRRKVGIVNILLLVGIVINIIYIIDYTITGVYFNMVFDIPINLVFPLGLFLNYKQKYKTTIWLVILLLPIHLLVADLAHKDINITSSGYDHILVAFCFIVFILLEKKLELLFATLYILSFFLLMHLDSPYFNELFKDVSKDPEYYYYLNTIIGFILSIIAISLFKRDNRRYFEQIVTQNIEIIKQKDEIEEQNTMLSEFNIELEKSNQSKDKFFSIISHDLISPFNSILGLLELLDTDYNDFSDKEKKEMISQILNVSENTHSLLVNILTWAKSQIGKIDINKEKINLYKLIVSSIEPYIFYANQKQLTINIDTPKNIFINADISTIETVIRNIFNNAVKFTSNHGTININAKHTDNKVIVSIKDNGVGIEQKFIDKIFIIDENHSTLGTNDEKGTGLGLMLCKEFVELNGGNIYIESEKGVGSTFSFSLPD